MLAKRFAATGVAPASVGHLTALRELHAMNDSLETLPDGIGDLKALRRLDLQGNALTCLPESVGGLENLTDLNLRQPTDGATGGSRGIAESCEAGFALESVFHAAGVDRASNGSPMRCVRLTVYGAGEAPVPPSLH